MKETLHGPAMAITPGVDLIDSALVSDVVSSQSSFEEQLNAKDQVMLPCCHPPPPLYKS